jgi:hypothetical protein
MTSVGNGHFDFINENERIMYTTAHSAISQLELWHFMQKDIETYMFSDAPEVNRISSKIVDLGYYGHSGSSFGSIMRDMQYIAQYGYDKFKEKYLARG